MVARVFLGNLSFNVTQWHILQAIEELVPYAQVEHVQICRKGRLEDGKKCCAFLSFPSDAEASQVIQDLNGVAVPTLSQSFVRAERAVPRMVEMAAKAASKKKAAT